jgi:hypothetical protein
MEVQVRETRRMALGEEHPDTLSSMNSLAFTTKELGRKMDVIKLLTECVQLRNRILVLSILMHFLPLLRWLNGVKSTD